MDFEKIYEKYLNNEANEEEVKYIEQEINKAKKLNEIIDKMESTDIFNEADIKDVKKAKKAYNKKRIIQTIIISLSIILALFLASFGTVYKIGSNYANRTMSITYDDAKSISINYILNYDDDIKSNDIRIVDIKRKLELSSKISKSYYKYTVDIVCKYNVYEIEINGTTGLVLEINKE